MMITTKNPMMKMSIPGVDVTSAVPRDSRRQRGSRARAPTPHAP